MSDVKYKVGDKVRILSDARIYPTGEDVVKAFNVKSAIGLTAEISKIYDNNTAPYLLELPEACRTDLSQSGNCILSDGFWYKEEQLELVCDEIQSITDKNLRSVLIANGWKHIVESNCYEKDAYIISIVFGVPTLLSMCMREPDAQKYYKIQQKISYGNDTEYIHTSDFEEFLAFVQKRVELKPLKKENSKSEDLSEKLKTFADNMIKFENDIKDALNAGCQCVSCQESIKTNSTFACEFLRGSFAQELENSKKKERIKPKKTKEHIREIVIEELKAKEFKKIQESPQIVWEKDNLQAVFNDNFMSIEILYPKQYGWDGYAFPYNKHKSINKFLAKVDELLERKKCHFQPTCPITDTPYKYRPEPAKKEQPQFTKGQKIRCKIKATDRMGGIGNVDIIQNNKIYTFEKFHPKSIPGETYNAIEVKEFLGHQYHPDFFEPVEYVSFSKALEWLKEGYTVNRRGTNPDEAIKLKNGLVMTEWGGEPDGLFYKAILAHDWYWVEKPEGK